MEDHTPSMPSHLLVDDVEQKEERGVAGRGMGTVMESLLSEKPRLEFSEGLRDENGLERGEGRVNTKSEAEEPSVGVLPQPLQLSKGECYQPVLCVCVSL